LIVDMMKRFQKATPMQSEARTAYLALTAKIDEIRGLQREVTREIVALESSGAIPEPPTLSDEYSEPDHNLINGARFAGAAMPPANANNISLHQKLRRSEQLKLTMAEVERQLFDAQISLSGELLALYDGELRALHRERALAILKIFEINRDLELLRTKILQSGGVVGHSLDGWSAKLGGTIEQHTKWNDAQRNYLAACISSGVISDEDLEL
jgi:hypothetical protein